MEEPPSVPPNMSRPTTTSASPHDTHVNVVERYALAGIFRILLLVVSRSLIIAITFCLVIAVMLFIFAVAGSDGNTVWPYLWMIAFWPWALTGRSEFTDADFGLLILGWGFVIAIISFIFSKLNPRFHIRRRYVLGIVGIPFLADAVAMPLIAKPDDIVFFEIMLIVMYLVCCGSLAIMWMLEMIANSLVKTPDPAKEPRLS